MSAIKNYRVDSFVADLAIKAPVKLVTSSDVTLSGEQTVDTVVLLVGDRVLVANQTVPTENGIYTVETSAWQRTGDWDGSRDATNGTLIISTQNTEIELWKMTTTAGAFIPGTDTPTFTLLAPNDSESGTFTINWAGFSTAETSTATYRKIGDMVLLSIGDVAISGVSDAITKQSTAGDLPAAIIPVASQSAGMCKAADNGGTFVFGTVEISPTGAEIRVFRDVLSSLWTASGNATISPMTLMYYLG